MAESDGTVLLSQLANLLRLRNEVDRQIAEFIGRPATSGNLGEYIAAVVFDIQLEPTGVNPGYDGIFRSGPYSGKTVNVKLYSEDAGGLDIGPHPADFYLVLVGPKPLSKKGIRTLPRRIDSVYLIDIPRLRADLESRGVGIGIATSVRKAAWEQARIYPERADGPMALTSAQVEMLRLFDL